MRLKEMPISVNFRLQNITKNKTKRDLFVTHTHLFLFHVHRPPRFQISVKTTGFYTSTKNTRKNTSDTLINSLYPLPRGSPLRRPFSLFTLRSEKPPRKVFTLSPTLFLPSLASLVVCFPPPDGVAAGESNGSGSLLKRVGR